ncbi:MAG: hypothetical protein ABEJ60_03410 [Halodesulfurarchaeum sp.]
MATYYDFVLGFIPVVLFSIAGGLHLVGLGLQIGIAVGGLFAMGLIGHALFVNGPTAAEPTPSPAEPAATRTESVSTASAPMAD